MENFKNQFTVFCVLIGLSILLSAQPQALDVFIDFENATGEGDFVLGESPNSVRFTNFRIESPDNLNLLHSGTKSLVLIPGEKGVIRFERGVNLLQFYAAETNVKVGLKLKQKSLKSHH